MICPFLCLASGCDMVAPAQHCLSLIARPDLVGLVSIGHVAPASRMTRGRIRARLELAILIRTGARACKSGRLEAFRRGVLRVAASFDPSEGPFQVASGSLETMSLVQYHCYIRYPGPMFSKCSFLHYTSHRSSSTALPV